MAEKETLESVLQLAEDEGRVGDYVEEMQRTGAVYTAPHEAWPEGGIMCGRPVLLGAVQAWIVVQEPPVSDGEAGPFVYELF